jgi:tRNA (cmo5U34)-methyltransferase
MGNTRDQLFEQIERIEDFSFDAKVAAVFDDMVARSVPFYAEVQRMVVETANSFLQKGGVFCDIGCSTGTTIEALAALQPESTVRYVGIDPSAPMLEQATQKLAHLSDRVELLHGSVQEEHMLRPANVVAMLYTLQFIRPIDRAEVISRIHDSILPGGCFILAEKVLSDTRFARRRFIEFYHEYKGRNGYSANEIAKKRDALENVLIPYENQENILMLRKAGFQEIEQAFRWYNFALYIAVRD